MPEARKPGAVLRAECRAFCHYLVSVPPDEYIQDWYRRGHSSIPCRLTGAIDRFDQALLWFARQGAGSARVADAYARRFRPYGVLRQKLVLLLAILEYAPGSRLTRGWTGSRAGFWLALTGNGLLSAGALLAGVILLGPVHLLLAGRPAGMETAE